MKIVTWNIRHGGSLKAPVANTLLAFQADVLVVTEFQLGPKGDDLVGALSRSGYHASHPAAPKASNTVMVATRRPITACGRVGVALPDPRHLWQVETAGLAVVGVYLPGLQAKQSYWEEIIRRASSADAPDLFIGDFNTGTNTLDKDPGGTPFWGPQFMDGIAATGFTDLWRARHPDQREYSWFSPGKKNGFRLDHAFGTPRLHGRVVDCRYDHAPRLAAVSDHSALVIDIRDGLTDAGK